ncbi:MAG: hypothetical protein J6K89_03055, partial [Oscillospiraceae bacterium]|nr:hypothetical protein [Oscillospiraceae bacterium]
RALRVRFMAERHEYKNHRIRCNFSKKSKHFSQPPILGGCRTRNARPYERYGKSEFVEMVVGCVGFTTAFFSEAVIEWRHKKMPPKEEDEG